MKGDCGGNVSLTLQSCAPALPDHFALADCIRLLSPNPAPVRRAQVLLIKPPAPKKEESFLIRFFKDNVYDLNDMTKYNK